MKKELVKLSASRIKTLQTCSWTYYCNYILKLPQKNNSGAMRGTIAHLIFEVLGNPRRADYVTRIVGEGTALKEKSIFALIIKTAKSEGLDLDEMVAPLTKKGVDVTNLVLIDQMILTGLKFDFISGNEVVGTELSFDITNESPQYRIRGFVDRVFEEGEDLVIRDFKSSKKTFKGEELSSNLQAMIYTLAMKKEFKKHKNVLVKFLFLRFPKDPEQECPKFTDEELEGFEEYLAYISEYLEDFTEEKGKSNYASESWSTKWLCKAGKTWRCPYIDPIDYRVLLNEDGETIKSVFMNEDFKPSEIKKGWTVEVRKYEGCPAHKLTATAASGSNDFGF